MIPIFKVFMSEDVLKPVSDLLMSGYVGQGDKVDEFEKLITAYNGNPYINTVNSATSGLHLSLRMTDCKVGDEVLTTPLTCFATNAPILANGYKVKWVDVDPNTCNVDLDDLERKLSPTTKAIMVVHWGGYPVDLDRLKLIQNKCKALYGHAPDIIEDCAHAWGSKYKEKTLGNHGNTAVFSFQAIKHITSVDGGCIAHPNEFLWKRAKNLRWYGLDRTKSADYRCLYPNTKVRFADGSTRRIAEVVKSKDEGPVLVEEKGKLVSKKIIGWHKNKLNNRKLLSISTKSLFPQYKTIVTEDHLILGKNKWIKASDLNSKYKVATSFPNPNKIQNEIIIGSLLGDGCITVRRNQSQRAVYCEQHTAVDEEYVRLKSKSLSGLHTKIIYVKPNKRNNRPNGAYYFYSRSLPSLATYRNQFYVDGKKIIPRKIVKDNFSKILLACWYLDDGHTKVVNQRDGLVYFSQLATNSFSELDVKWLCDLLSEKGYECSCADHSGWRIFFTKNGSKNLLKDISKFVPKSMRYKVGHNNEFDEFDENLWNTGESDVFFDQVIVEEFENKKYDTVYCLSVEGESPNFASSAVIVHNCEQNIEEWGYKFHMNDLNATIGIYNLIHANRMIETNKSNASHYNFTLKNIHGLEIMENKDDRESAYWIYTLRVKNRDNFIKMMTEKGIAVSRVHNRNDEHDCMREFKCALPSLDKVCKDMICIPCGWWVSVEDREYIVDCIKKGW